MHKKIQLFFLLLIPVHSVHASESWNDIGSSFSGFGSSIWQGIKAMGEGLIGKTPSGYYYDFRVFNGSNVPIFIAVEKAKNIMGARWSMGTGDAVTLQPGWDSNTTFEKESLYFAIKITGPQGLDYVEDHYTLGQHDDGTVSYYHAYNNKDSGAPCAELLGAGYTTSVGFSGRIENKTNAVTTVTFSLTANGADASSGALTMTVPDIDPQSFNFLKSPAGYSLRPSVLILNQQFPLAIQKNGIAQVTKSSSASSSGPSSNPCTYNYIFNGTTAFETGMGPGNFDQPQTMESVRDISPVECQIYYENSQTSTPLGVLFPFDIPGESLWYVYGGYGWSQAQKQIVKYPCGQIALGQCASCFLIRPSQQSLKTDPSAGRLYIVRLSIPEQNSATEQQKAQNFLTNMITGRCSIAGLSKDVNQIFPFVPGSTVMMYPPLSESYVGSFVNLSSLTMQQKAKLLGIVLPDQVGLLYDHQTNISGYIMISDVFYPYGMGSGPFYYLMQSAYLDISQMIGSLCNYAGITGFTGLTQAIYTQLQQVVLPQTVLGWIQQYPQNSEQVMQSIATFLVQLGQGNVDKLVSEFGQSTFNLYSEPDAVKKLSASGTSFLKMLLYGPCSMSQAPVYYRAGTSYFHLQDGWPAVTQNL